MVRILGTIADSTGLLLTGKLHITYINHESALQNDIFDIENGDIDIDFNNTDDENNLYRFSFFSNNVHKFPLLSIHAKIPNKNKIHFDNLIPTEVEFIDYIKRYKPDQIQTFQKLLSEIHKDN